MSDDAIAPMLDCLIIGGGPAGLTAATYLARFHRDVVLVDCDESRARYIPVSHNCPGFPFGVSGNDLLAKMRAQAAQFGIQPVRVRIERIVREANGFTASTDRQSWRARTLLLATGIKDRLPELPDLDAAIADGVMRICAICDGYETAGSRVGVYGPPASVVGHACFLRTFSADVSVVLSEPGEVSESDRARAAALGIEILQPADSFALDRSAKQAWESCTFSWSHGKRTFDTVYPVLGSDVKGHLASDLGARRDELGELIVDARMQTSVDGCYAAGDAVSSINQIAVAVGHAAIAAITIHNRLPRNPFDRAGSDP